MPKTARKPRKKMTAEKQPDARMRQKISAAVAELSKSAAARVASARDESAARTTKLTPRTLERLLLWTGVIILTLAILGFWLVNIRSVFGDIGNAPITREQRFWQEAKADVNAALEQTAAQTPEKTNTAAKAPTDAEIQTALRASLRSLH